MANSGVLHIARGSTLVFEGLDATGKSTQVQRLRDRTVAEGAQFVHMPTGFTSFTSSLRQVLENPETKPLSPLAKQLAHLSCHAEAMGELERIQADHALVLDRWWWSTIAYGWNAISSSSLSRRDFETLATSIWAPIQATQVFLFLSPYRQDANNDPAVAGEYRRLAERSDVEVYDVGSMSEDEVHEAIVGQLLTRGLASLA